MNMYVGIVSMNMLNRGVKDEFWSAPGLNTGSVGFHSNWLRHLETSGIPYHCSGKFKCVNFKRLKFKLRSWLRSHNV